MRSENRNVIHFEKSFNQNMNLSYYHRPLAFTMLWAVISASHALMRPLCAAKINAVLSLLNVLVHLTVLHCFKSARYGMILAVSMIHWCGICNCVVDDQSSITGYCSCKNILSANQTLWRWFLNKNSSQLIKCAVLTALTYFSHCQQSASQITIATK